MVDPTLAANYGATLTYNTALSSAGTAVINFHTTTGLRNATTSITQASESGSTVTITTATVLGLTAGQTVTIAGFYGVDNYLVGGYNGTFTVASSSGTSFTYADTATGLGTVTATGTVNTPVLLGGLMATVPSGAYYKSKDLLSFSSVSLIAGTSSVAAIGAYALHLVAFPGDAAGAGIIASSDALDMEQVLAGASAGFAAYPLVNPNIIGDLAGQGSLNGFAVSLLTGSINLVVTPQMPVYPARPKNMASGPDPTVSIPSTLQLGSDGSVTVPVDIDDPHPAGSTGMTQATLALAHHLADGLFAALDRGTVEAAELAILGSGAEQSLGQTLAAEMSTAGSAQANLDSFLWESGDSSWLDGEQDWLP